MSAPFWNECGFCTSVLGKLNRVRRGNTKIKFKDKSLIRDVEIIEAISFIYGISWNSGSQTVVNSIDDPSLRICTRCTKRLEVCYSALKKLEKVLHPESRVQCMILNKEDKISKNWGPNKETAVEVKTEYEQNECDFANSPFSNWNFENNEEGEHHEAAEHDQAEIKYEPFDMSVEEFGQQNSESIEDIKLRLEKREVVIKLERMSQENITVALTRKTALGKRSLNIREQLYKNKRLRNPKQKAATTGKENSDLQRFSNRLAGIKVEVEEELTSNDFNNRPNKNNIGSSSMTAGNEIYANPNLKSKKRIPTVRCVSKTEIKAAPSKGEVKKKNRGPTKRKFRYGCTNCLLTFTKSSSYQSHICLLTESRAQCLKCKKVFKWKCLLRQHSCGNINKTIFHCNVCKKGFLWRFSLKNHNESQCGKYRKRISYSKKYFPCRKCGVILKTAKVTHKCGGELKNQQEKYCHSVRSKLKAQIKGQHIQKRKNHFHGDSNNHIKSLSTSASPKGKRSLQCDTCSRMFIFPNTLRNHKIRRHTFKCLKCKKVFLDQFSLNTHEIRHRPPKSIVWKSGFKCEHCEQLFQKYRQLKRHRQTHRPIKCEECDQIVHGSDELRLHIRRFHTKEFGCDLCDSVFDYGSALLHHINKRTPGELFNCSQCEKKYCLQLSLRIHCLRIHCSRSTTCDICHKKLKTLVCMRRHALTHEPRPRSFTCAICGQGFMDKMVLDSHIRTHDPEPRYTCDTCGKRFRRMHRLRDHNLKHKGVKFECKTCGKVFSHREYLKKHMATHGEPQLKCEVCGKCFHNYAQLWKHRRSHGPKTETCPQCNKSFVEKMALQNHMVVHSEDRPYHCTHCERRFKLKSHLVPHMRVVHKIKVESASISKSAQ